MDKRRDRASFLAGMFAMLSFMGLFLTSAGEIGWFDRPENQAEVQSLHQVTGTKLGVFLQEIALVVSDLMIAFTHNWKLIFIAFTFVPALFPGGSVAQEAFGSYRTLAALGLEEFFYLKFRQQSKSSIKRQYEQVTQIAFVHALANGIFFSLIAVFRPPQI
ncbi:hypothetical protein ACTXT7_001796 [Hymenolepis weldensis]